MLRLPQPFFLLLLLPLLHPTTAKHSISNTAAAAATPTSRINNDPGPPSVLLSLICHDISTNEKSQLRAKATEGLQAFHRRNFTMAAAPDLIFRVKEKEIYPAVAKASKMSDLKAIVEGMLAYITDPASPMYGNNDDTRDFLLDYLQTHLNASFASLEGYLDPHRFPFFMNTIVSVIKARLVPVLQMVEIGAKAYADQLPLPAAFFSDVNNMQTFALSEDRVRVAVYLERVMTSFLYEASLPVVVFLAGTDSSALMDVVVPLWKEECKKEMEKMLPGGMAKEL